MRSAHAARLWERRRRTGERLQKRRRSEQR